MLKGKKLIIACPKLDETEAYVEKLTEIIKHNNLSSLTVAIMTVPCCSGLYRIVEDALDRSGIKIELKKKLIHIDGKIIS
jgi:intein/homing endonuclease